jgi:cellulose synthase/poly-beta-1,6-N-acetylglucosamine synthase-like glycosyltransferase
MRLLFWFCAFLIMFAYAGYPICLYLRAKLWPRPVRRASIFPRVTIVLAVHNEEKTISAKLRNLAALDYPADLLEVIVVSDGSTDDTNNILAAWQNPVCRTVILPAHRGKANALNHGFTVAKGEIICFTDARQAIASDGLKLLIDNFADPEVGCASGALMLHDNSPGQFSDGVGLYWQLEKKIRNWEGLAGSTVGATGAFYAVRKTLLKPLPIGTILDDVYIPVQVARQGWRVIFDAKAVALDNFAPDASQEFRRKVRTLTGIYQLLGLAPWLLTRSHPVRIQFFCHKLLRLFVPFALVGVLFSALWLREGIYGIALVLQIVLYGLAVLSPLRANVGSLSRLSGISLAFLLLNTAAALALIYFITGRKALWAR